MSDRQALLTSIKVLSSEDKPHRNRHVIIITIILIMIVCILAILVFAFDILSLFNDDSSYSTTNKQPNIIVIMMDDLGFTDVGYNGYKLTGFNTPTLDNLANIGIILNYNYVSICSPTRSSFLSGRYSWKSSLNAPALPWSYDEMDTDIITIADILSNNNYNTLMTGKWHLGYSSNNNLPTAKGFDKALYHQYGEMDYYKHSVCYNIDPFLNFGMLQQPENITIKNKLNEYFNYTFCGYDIHDENYNIIYDTETYYEQLFTDYVLEFIQNQSNQPNFKPFFIYYSMLTPHTPLTYPPLSINYTQCDIFLDERKMLCQMIKYADYMIERIVNKLIELDMFNNTIIVMLSDNGAATYPWGYGQNLPLRGGKGTQFEGNIRTNAFISGGYINNFYNITGCQYNHLFYVTDWFPVLTYIANITANISNNIDGINIFPDILNQCGADINGTEIIERDEIIQMSFCGDVSNNYFSATYIRTKEWKLIINATQFNCNEGGLFYYFDAYKKQYSIYPNEESYILLNNEYENVSEGLFYSKCYHDMTEFNKTNENNTIFHTFDDILLYHIIDDKIEACNVANKYPNIVNMLIQRLNEEKKYYYYYNSTQTAQSNAAIVLSQIDTYDCHTKTTYFRTWKEINDFRSGINYSNQSFNDWDFTWNVYTQRYESCFSSTS